MVALHTATAISLDFFPPILQESEPNQEKQSSLGALQTPAGLEGMATPWGSDEGCNICTGFYAWTSWGSCKDDAPTHPKSTATGSCQAGHMPGPCSSSGLQLNTESCSAAGAERDLEIQEQEVQEWDGGRRRPSVNRDESLICRGNKNPIAGVREVPVSHLTLTPHWCPFGCQSPGAHSTSPHGPTALLAAPQ